MNAKARKFKKKKKKRDEKRKKVEEGRACVAEREKIMNAFFSFFKRKLEKRFLLFFEKYLHSFF